MPKRASVILPPDVDEFCYLIAQALVRQFNEENATNRGKESRPNASIVKGAVALSGQKRLDQGGKDD